MAEEQASTASPTLKIEEISVAAVGIPGAMVYVCDTLPPAATPGPLAKGCKFLTPLFSFLFSFFFSFLPSVVVFFLFIEIYIVQ